MLKSSYDWAKDSNDIYIPLSPRLLQFVVLDDVSTRVSFYSQVDDPREVYCDMSDVQRVSTKLD